MVLTILDYIIFSAGVISLSVWLIFFFKGLSKASIFEPLDEKEYPFKEIYFVGYALAESVKYQYKSKNDRETRKNLEVLYDAKYADYYLRVIMSQRLTIAMTVFVLSFALYGLADSVAVLLVGFMFSGLAYYYFGTVTKSRITKRSDEMLSDFSEVVSKLALLTNAGMILREAWEDVAYTGESALYKEMQYAVNEMNNGVAEVDAIYNFGIRCIIPEIKKFTSTIVQSMIKGNGEISSMLLTQSNEVWSLKKQRVRRQGEKAASKLLIPICIMFVGILVMVIIPIFANLGV